MVTPSSNLVQIHDTLVPAIAAAMPSAGATKVQFLQDVAGPLPVAEDTIARVLFIPPRRLLVASEGDPQIQQVGSLEVQWLFPREKGWTFVRGALESTAAAMHERTMANGLRLHGDTRSFRENDEQGRSVYRIAVDWEITQQEFSAGDARAQLTQVTDAEAIRAVRDVWGQRIEAAVPAESWAGLPTQWDTMPQGIPPLPWAAIFIGEIAATAIEIGATHETVDGRALVQMHTDPRAGAVPTLRILERVLAEHNCATRQVHIGPASVEAQSMSPAATLQTSLRIPFVYERARP